jgi:tetratricopeptide (TPR) repeat protein
MIAVQHLNNRGIGLMERFEYEDAVKAFDELVRLDPDWLPGQINRGIALFNTRESPNIQRAIELFQNILKRDTKNPHAHFCLGVIYQYQGDKTPQARKHFEEVTRIDPQDAHAWYYLGYNTPDDPEIQKQCYEKALEYGPYLRRALNGLQVLVRTEDPKRAQELLDRFLALDKNFGYSEKERYGEMGKYAEAIGRMAQDAKHPYGPVPVFSPQEKFAVKLKAGARWAKAADFGQGSAADLRRKTRERFGATMVVLDYNRDGKPDLLLLGAIVEAGQVRDLLLRNDGNDVFTDVTHEAGLAEPRLSLGCTVGDFDNDGFPDLFITGIGKQWLFRNKGKRGHGFDNVTAEAGLDKLDGVCLGSCFLDLDQDGDLDLVVARFAASAEQALDILNKGAVQKPQGGFVIYLNVGEARPVAPNVDPPPLDPAFKKLELPAALPSSEAAVGLAATDIEKDGDLDLLLLADGTPGAVLLNDRLLRFRRSVLPKHLIPPRLWNGALVLDGNHQGRSDLFLISPDQAPVYIVSKPVPPGQKELDQWFDKGVCKAPPLLQAQAIDLDYDGWTDILGLSDKHVPVLLQNQAGKLVHIPEGLGSDQAWPKDLVSVMAGPFNSEKYPHLLVWSESNGLAMWKNQGNGNQALKLELTGHRRVSEPLPVRCNAEGFGTRVMVQTADHWTGAEYTTLSAGLGQSYQPLILGLGKHSQAEVVRLRWPDNCWQAELNKPACHVIRIEEINRRPDSCPLLFACDGNRYTFISDFLGAGAIGETLPDRTCRQPRAEESIKIEAHQMVPKDGFYLLKIAEAMNEVTYLDQLKLDVVDHPAEVRVYPDERFVISGPLPSQSLLAFQTGQEILPRKATNHKGKDVTAKLRHWDRDTLNDFARRTWAGYAEEHWVELDFGDRLSRFGSQDRLTMFLAGWTDYPYPESMWAATQAGVSLEAPILERKQPDGTWQTLVAEAGFPAGLPRMTTLDLTGKVFGKNCVLRLRTNMHVFWDQIFVAPLVPGGKENNRLSTLHVHHALLEERGCLQEFSPDGKQPTLYDYHRLDKVPVFIQSGKLTRLGEVTELLEERDDRFVIFGPGDEITIQFDARKLPPLPAGWTRSFVLRTAGYSKSSGPFIETGNAVEPLPFQKMSRFPYGPEESYPRTPRHEEYRRRYNTRQVGSSRR